MEWISVKDQAPKEHERVLVFCPMGNLGNPFIAVAYRVDFTWHDFNNDRSFDTPQPVTHWMPLPEPPKQ